MSNKSKSIMRLEEFDEEITRVHWISIDEMKQHYQTVDRVVFQDQPRLKEIWHIVKSLRKDET